MIEILRGHGVPVHDLLPASSSPDPKHVRACAIVFDLAPGGDEAMRTLRRLRLQHPFAKLLLYPTSAGAGDIIRRAASVPGWDLEIQQEGESGLQSLRKKIQQLLASVPLGQAEAVLQLTAPALLKRLPGFVESVINATLDLGEKKSVGHLVSRVAAALGAGRGLLEEFCRDHHLPTPAKLVNATLLLWLTSVAELGAITTAAAAQHANISGVRLHRIRGDLLSRVDLAELTPRAEFFLVVRALGSQCGVNVEQFLREREERDGQGKEQDSG